MIKYVIMQQIEAIYDKGVCETKPLLCPTRMKGDRLKVPVDATYLSALGCATYCFARMEWDAVYCGQKLSPGFIDTVSRKTAGTIGKDIRELAHLITEPGTRALYDATVDEFTRLVSRRNDLCTPILRRLAVIRDWSATALPGNSTRLTTLLTSLQPARWN